MPRRGCRSNHCGNVSGVFVGDAELSGELAEVADGARLAAAAIQVDELGDR